jgi:hypothetical protein
MSAPYEVVSGPLTVYVAPVGTAFPAINAAPGGSWFKLGSNGADNYDEPGVTVSHDQTIATWTAAGSTAPRKAFRTVEGQLIEFTLVDLIMEQYAKIMNDATVNTTVGPPATKDINLLLGTNVVTFALIARGTSSAYGDSLPAQYQVPICFQNGSPKPLYEKSKPAGLAIQYASLKDSALGFGKLMVQTA